MILPSPPGLWLLVHSVGLAQNDIGIGLSDMSTAITQMLLAGFQDTRLGSCLIAKDNGLIREERMNGGQHGGEIVLGFCPRDLADNQNCRS
jgi:hypothetical protein